MAMSSLLTHPTYAVMRASWTSLTVIIAANVALLAFLGASPTLAQTGEKSCCDYPVASGECDLYPLSSYRVTSDMLDPDYGLGQHTGEDWNRGGGDDDLGDPVCSIGDGVVVASGSYLRWSNVVVVRHDLPGGVRWSQYAHLQERIANVGDRVVRGQMIGTIGRQFTERPCRSDGVYCSHLHFEIRRADVPPNNWPNDAVVILQQYLDPTDHARDIRPEVGFIEANPVTSPGDSEPNPGDWTITLNGVGPLRVGMSISEVRRAAGPLDVLSNSYDFQRATLRRGPRGVTLHSTYGGGWVMGIEVDRPGILTPSGVGVGDTASRLQRTYPGRLRGHWVGNDWWLSYEGRDDADFGKNLHFIMRDGRVHMIYVTYDEGGY